MRWHTLVRATRTPLNAPPRSEVVAKKTYDQPETRGCEGKRERG